MRSAGKQCFWIMSLLLPLWTAAGMCATPLGPHPVGGGTQFSYRPQGKVRTVHLAGEFNGWDIAATPMADEDGDGIWTAVVTLPPGRWEYKFVVDEGTWITDPYAHDMNYDNFNNGIVYVGQELPADAGKWRSDVPWAEDDELTPHPIEGGILFSYQAPEGTRMVYLAGEFNGWSTGATPMADEDGDGIWRIWYPLRPGRSYEYKFVADGQWITDPNAPQTNPSNYNNGIIFVAEPGVPYAVMDFPTDGSRPDQIAPVAGHLRCYQDDVDPSSIQVRLDERVLSHQYDPTSGRFSAPLPKDLPDLDYRLVVTARGLDSGKLGKTQVYFTMDREPAVFDSPDFFDRAVIYEIFVRSFRDADGDSIGDLKGVIQMLDYLNDGDPTSDEDLGIEAIWLMPVCQSPSYHGYDVTDYHTIEQDYGTNEDFFALCREAHQRGVRVIFDLVINHCSSQHPYFIDALGNPSSPYSEWFKFLDSERTEYEAFAGYRGMPEFNYDSRDLRDWLLEMAKFWMDPNGDGDFSDGVDGYRLDVGKGPPHDWWKELRRELKKVRPDFLLLGEVWDNVETIYGYFDYEFDMQFDYPFYYELLQFIRGAVDKHDLYLLLKEEKKKFPLEAQLCRFLGNHDNDRILSALGGDQQRNRLAALILFTLSGTPLIYYGEEVGMTGVNPPDEAIRTAMAWDQVTGQRRDPNSLFHWYRQLIHLRSTYPALRARDDRDQTSHQGLITVHPEVCAYLRYEQNADPFMAVFNFSDELIDEYRIRATHSALKPGRYQVQDVLRDPPEGECARLQVASRGRISGYRPLLQLEPNSGYLLRLKLLE